MDLKNITTQKMLEELVKRQGIKKIAVGRYQPCELLCKYLDKRYEPEFDFLIGVNINEFLDNVDNCAKPF